MANKTARFLILSVLAICAPLTAVATEIGDIKIDKQVESKKKAGVGPVIFPHARHAKLHRCDACHPKIFAEKTGANAITMKANMDGKFCGSPNCHNSPKAFPLYNCGKCHTNIKKPGT